MQQKKQQLLLGAHMSIAGGLEQSILRGESIGCTTIQIFTKSNRQWAGRSLSETEIGLFKKTTKSGSINAVIAHASYLLNIGATNKEIHTKSASSLRTELIRCQQLEIPYLVIHPGAYAKGTEKTCLEKISDTLNELFYDIPGKTIILLENMAGQGSTVGHTFEQLAEIYEKSSFKNRLGICFDTCHAFAADYSFSTEEEYNNMWNIFDSIVGLKLIKCIHVNDSKKELGSRIDRHENIGKGKIGLESFKFLMNDQRFFDVPKIIETPKIDLNDDKKNLQKLIGLLTETTVKKLIINQIFQK